MSNEATPVDVPARMPTFLELCAGWHKTLSNLEKFNRLLVTDAKIAQTPKELVWTLNKAKLYRYVPVVPENERKRIPLLMVFAIMNRPYVLDLRPGHSFTEYMLRHGYDLFLLDWGIPGPEDANMSFDEYALNYLPRVVRKVKSITGSDEFSILGWCLGALISTMYSALRANDGLKNLILLTAPLDFSDKTAGGFARWSSNEKFNPDTVVSQFGNVPGEMIDTGAKMLRPVENFIGNYVMLWDNIENPGAVDAWHAMNTWVRDIIPLPGAAYQQLINDMYKQNRLMEGTMQLRGETIDLKNLRANLLNVIAESDHITPACQSERILDVTGSEDKDVLRVRGGHIGIMAGRGAEKNTWPHIESWLAPRSV
ncbi:MAG: alpha/beta fold hydrolase [Pirellulales bacterium]